MREKDLGITISSVGIMFYLSGLNVLSNCIVYLGK